MGVKDWKSIGCIKWREVSVEELKVRPENCPVPYEKSADTKGLELDEFDFCICRREKRVEGGKLQIMHNCPYLRGYRGPMPRVICSYPEKEDIS